MKGPCQSDRGPYRAPLQQVTAAPVGRAGTVHMPVATLSVALAQLKVTVTGRSSKDEPTLHRNVGYLVTTACLVARALDDVVIFVR